MNPFSNGIRVEMPGNPELNSAMVAIPFVVALRPVSSDDRVGEHSAVVWKFENARPCRRCGASSASRPDRRSSPSCRSRRRPTPGTARSGAPSGAFGARYGAQSGTESRTSSSILPANSRAMSVTSPDDHGPSRPWIPMPGQPGTCTDAEHAGIVAVGLLRLCPRWSPCSTGAPCSHPVPQQGQRRHPNWVKYPHDALDGELFVGRQLSPGAARGHLRTSIPWLPR